MKKRLLTTVLVAALSCTAALGFAACGGNNEDPTPTPHTHTFSEDWVNTDATQHWHAATCEHTNEKSDVADHVYTDAQDTTCDVCGHVRTVQCDENFSAPVVDVLEQNPEITSGVPFDVFEILEISDEYDEFEDLDIDIQSTPTFDMENPAEGSYVLTISVTNSKGKTTTVTLNVTVEAPLPSLVVEVETERDTNWVKNGVNGSHVEKKLIFPGDAYIKIDENTPKTEEDGAENGKTWKAGVVNYLYGKTAVFHNTTDEPVTVHMQGSGGETAILDSTGYLIEGRDGANGKFVNAEYPVRTSSDLKSYTYETWGEVKGTDNAKYMTIPAGGFAIVVMNLGKDGPFGYNPDLDTNPSANNFDYDGRGWLNKNIVAQYGYTAKIYFADDPETLLNTTFTNHAPVLKSAPAIPVTQGDGTTLDTLKTKILEGVNYVDDKGTFVNSDDVTSGLTVELVGENSEPEYKNEEGEYTFTLKVTDEGGLSTQFTRKVVVGPAVPEVATIEIGGTRFNVSADGDLAVNPENLTSTETYHVVIYTSYFTGKRVVNKYGFYFVVGADNKVKEVSIPGGSRYKLGANGSKELIGPVNNDDTLAPVELAPGEYVVLALNQNTGSRRDEFKNHFTNDTSNYLLGADVTLWNINYLPTIKVTDGSSDKTWSGNSVVINEKVTSAVASNSYFLVYSYGSVDEVTTNGYGCAIVINSEGKIVRIFEAINGGPLFYDTEHYWEAGNLTGGNRIPNGTDPYLADRGWTFDANTYAKAAYKSLSEGEILIVFPHSTTLPSTPRAFGGQFRQDFSKYTVTFENFGIPEPEPEPEPEDKSTLTIGSATLDVDKYVVDKDNATASDGLIIYNYGFSGTSITDGFGVAVVVNKATGKIVRAYDGMSPKYYDAEHPSGENIADKCTGAGYAKEAFNSLQEGEYVIIFAQTSGLRDWAYSNARKYDATVVLTNISLEAE